MTRPLPDFSHSPSGDHARYRITHERGPMTRQVRTAAFAQGGEVAWEALLATVSPACRARFAHAIGYYDWVESELALELHEAWARQCGRDDMAQRGEDAAREILGGVQRWILRMASPTFVLENLPRAFRLYYRGGEMGLLKHAPGEGVLGFRAAGYPEPWFHHGIPSALIVALELSGARDVAVQHVLPEPGGLEPCLHRYEIAWRR